MPVVSTNLKHDPGNTEDSLCNWVQLLDVNFLLIPYGSHAANTVPYLIALSTDHPINLFITSAYSFSSPSSSWSNKCRASTYVDIIR